MADDTLRSFLVALGFKVDESSWGRFESTVTKATLQAQLLAVAIEAMAKSIATHVADVADSFDQLYWQTQRMGVGAAP